MQSGLEQQRVAQIEVNRGYVPLLLQNYLWKELIDLSDLRSKQCTLHLVLMIQRTQIKHGLDEDNF